MTTSHVETLRVEYRRDSAFVASVTPRVSWVVETSIPEWTQISAELRLDGVEVAVLDGEDNVLGIVGNCFKHQRCLSIQVDTNAQSNPF